MNIVIDSNIIFSALIRPSLTRKLIIDYEGLFLCPSFVFIEYQRHKDYIIEKSRLAKQELDELMKHLRSNVLVVPNASLLPFKEEAKSILKGIDNDDTMFFACALAYPNSIIWSNDKALKLQRRVVVMNTEEIIPLIRGGKP